MKTKIIKTKKMKIWNLIDIIYILFIITISFIKTNSKIYIETFINTEELLVKTCLICLMLIIIFINSIPYFAIYFGIRYAIKKQQIRNVKFNIVEDLDYYRDMFKNISPATISLLTNLNIENKKDISSMILYYEKNKIIKYNDQRQIIVLDNNNSILKTSDRYLLNYLVNNNVVALKEWKKM